MPEAASAPRLRRAGVELIAVSFVVLFQELALIRWLGSQVRVLAYFPNLILISAFLGLGAGCLLARVRSSMVLWPPAVLLAIATAVGMSRIAFTQESISDHLWLLYYDLPRDAPVVHGIRIPILVVFVTSAIAFVPLGQFVAARLRQFRAAGRSLAGYSCDLGGSLIGTAAFAAASFLGAFPAAWFATMAAVSVAFLVARRDWLISGVAAFSALILFVAWADSADCYSPYYALRRVELKNNLGFLILANGSQHQYAAPLRASDPLTRPENESLRTGYHLPYRLAAKQPRRVLILGAGSGNDAAVALDEGAARVDAIEIDPAIIEMGRESHPDKPYADPRVRIINTDARSFLNGTSQQYDLIVFGTLDSMTRLSALSNVRLDNFVYTRECLHSVREHLAPGGGMALYFGTGLDYIDARFRALMEREFGRPPAVVEKNFGSFNRLYLAGPAFARLPAARATGRVILPTDDWPFLYLRSRAITPFYLSLITAIAMIASLTVWGAAAAARAGGPAFDSVFFLFGLAFLLLESKSVTEMNLVWGSTWLTSAIVFASILAMILAGTLLMAWRPVQWGVAASGLVVTLIANYLTPVQVALAMGPALKLLLSAAFVGLPIFFASICFALQFRDERSADRAFGWNLLGAVGGGLLEFCSMAIGLKLLSLVALAAYAAAFALRRPRELSVG
jgi:SAM-dependent methyltransferase